MSLISHPARPLLGLAVVAALAGCAATATKPTAVEANITTKAVGYLDKSAVPASLDLVPAPPVAGSAALALDEQVSREARALRGSPRFAQAGVDAELGFPEGANHFSCAADIDVDAVKTPGAVSPAGAQPDRRQCGDQGGQEPLPAPAPVHGQW